MLKRLYVHNFRCLENFDLALGEFRSVLLIGKNGAGKTTIGLALEILQAIARGTNRVGDLVSPKDLTRGRTDVPVRFEVEVVLEGRNYSYSVAFKLPNGFQELRVFEELLAVDGIPVFTRELAQVRLARTGQLSESTFRMAGHLVALPIIQEQTAADPLFVFREWLANMLILRPVPSLARGDSAHDSLRPDAQATNVGAWFSGMVATAPATYSAVHDYLREIMPDFKEVKNPISGKDTRSLALYFGKDQQTIEFALEDLSDGEKCFVIYALTIAANAAYGPLLCFWDEPDNFLAPAEVSPSIMALRRAFRDQGQLIVTSHNPEAIRRFSDENTFVLFRNSHSEPAIARTVGEIRNSGDLKGDFVDALLRGDIDA
jgi:predicted ATPase